MSIIESMIKTYRLVYQVKANYPLEIIVTTDLFHERLKLANTNCDQAIVQASKQELDDSQSLLVLPDNVDNHFYLLLHENLFDETQQYAQTIAYEYTRLIDYAEIQKKYQIPNIRAAQFPDSACILFLSEARAWYRGFSLYYNLTSVENKAVLFSYLCGTVPDYEPLLSYHLPAHMQALAEFYGQNLAISNYVNFDVSLPDYINHHPIHELLNAVRDNINNLSIFENFDSIHNAYEDYINHKSKDEKRHCHSHTCNNPNHHH